MLSPDIFQDSGYDVEEGFGFSLRARVCHLNGLVFNVLDPWAWAQHPQRIVISRKWRKQLCQFRTVELMIHRLKLKMLN